MIAYLEPAQFLGTLIIGVGVGIMLTRAYDAVQHERRMKRIRRTVVAYAEGFPLPIELTRPVSADSHRFLTTKTSGPETAPANRDPQEPAADDLSAPVTTGVAVSSADAGEGVAPPARSLTFTELANWRVDHGDDWDEYRYADGRKP